MNRTKLRPSESWGIVLAFAPLPSLVVFVLWSSLGARASTLVLS